MSRIGSSGWAVICAAMVIFSGMLHPPCARGALVSVGKTPVGVAVHPDGQVVYVSNAGDDTVAEVRLSDGVVTRTFQVGAYPAGLAVSPDGKYVYVACYEADGVYRISTADGTITSMASGTGPWDVVLNSVGTHLYVANAEGDAVSIFDTGTLAVTSSITVGDEPVGLAISHDDSTLYVSNHGSGSVSVVQLSTGVVAGTIEVGNFPVGVRLDTKGTALYVANFGDDTLSAISTTDPTLQETIPVGDGPSELAFSPDGRFLYVTCTNEGVVYVIDTTNNSIIARRVEHLPVGVDVLPDGSFYCVANFGADSLSILYRLLVEIILVSRPAVRSDGEVEITWRPSDAGTYRVEFGGSDVPGTGRLAAEGTVAALETVTTAFSGASLGQSEGSYRVYIYVTDSSGRSGGNYTSIRLDNTPPSTPVGFRGKGGDKRVFLKWTRGADSDLAGYRVYAGSASGQYDLEGSPIFIPDPHATSYTVKGLENDRRYYLVLSAIDEAGNESLPTAEIVVMPEEALGVSGLSGESENGCFIATACYGSAHHEAVRALRRVRDEFLAKDALGRGIIAMYNALGPMGARFIASRPGLKGLVRGALMPVVYLAPWLWGKPGPLCMLALVFLPGVLVILVVRSGRCG